MILQIVSFNVV